MKRARVPLLCLVITFALAVLLNPGSAVAAKKHTRSSRRSGAVSSKSTTRKKSARKRAAEKKNAPEINAKAPEETAETSRTSATASAPPPTRGPTRIDFDDRLIQGQTNKSGAVYLYDRKELKVRSMVKQRESFRDEIVGAVYDS
jgi:hypothetical protein